MKGVPIMTDQEAAKLFNLMFTPVAYTIPEQIGFPEQIFFSEKRCSLRPKRVIFNPPATIVEWEDGTKTVVKCHDDAFSEEFGFAMAVMRKIYGSRKEFMAQFKDAYRPYLNPTKKKKPAEQADAGVQS